MQPLPNIMHLNLNMVLEQSLIRGVILIDNIVLRSKKWSINPTGNKVNFIL